ncbi:Pre-rRNA-processing protein TSR2-domain-containing protein [Amylocystis lapponica]|nr:Pre-rRNA-processing protein TSR2-domain-containing protein [Amylocystis lapponica]
MQAAPPPATSVLFARGVLARLAVWGALRLAVDQGMGGPEAVQKRTWLASVLVDAFEQEHPAPDVDYVALTLLQVMEDEFDIVLEDGSADAVARDVVGLWEEVGAGKSETVLRLEAQADRVKGKKVIAEEGAADDSDWEDDEDSGDDGDVAEDEALDRQAKPHKTEPEVDDDGFTMVKGKFHR